MNKKKKEFASEVSIHETMLSQYINNSRLPNDKFMIRLEIHSNNNLPAVNWLRLVDKQKEYIISTDKDLRKKERAHVSNKLHLTL